MPRGYKKPDVCPFCHSPEFEVTTIQGPIVTCLCEHCFNAFILTGEWVYNDVSDSVRVRKNKEGLSG